MFSDAIHFTKLVHDASAWDFGATQINADDVGKNFLADNLTTGGVPMIGGVGMYNDYASIHAYWSDTTDMDNLRSADITDHSVAGSIEDVTRGGSTLHTPSGVSTATTPYVNVEVPDVVPYY
mmetsp:Transcript_15894/g.32624  ORF Transcript_15894/g.32624 Transcript_15894/m.32624 type:complete len:122 (+) Transcript_15894:64-429(+)